MRTALIFKKATITSLIIILTALSVTVVAVLYWGRFYGMSQNMAPQNISLWQRKFIQDNLRLYYSFKPTTHVFKVFQPTSDNNRLFVQNWTESNVQQIDTLGRVQVTFGQKGRGPGEFLQICNVSFDADGVYIGDQIQLRISHFNWSGTLIHSYPLKTHFSTAIKLSRQKYLLQTSYNGTSTMENFQIVELETATTSIIRVPRLEKSRSEDNDVLGMEMHGFFAHNHKDKIFRISTKTGQFVAFDTTGRYLYSRYTIDKTPFPEVIKKGESEGSIIQYGENSRSVNIFAAADEKHLYILSNAASPSIAEIKKGTNKDVVIDIYDVNDGHYQSSITLPLIGERKGLPSSIHVANNRLYVVDETTILCFALPTHI